MDGPAIGAVPVTFPVGGTPYKFARLRMLDICEFEQWVVDRRILTAAALLRDNQAALSLLAPAIQASITPALIQQEMTSAHGIARLLWQSARRCEGQGRLGENHFAEIASPVEYLTLSQLIDYLAQYTPSPPVPGIENPLAGPADGSASTPDSHAAQ